MVTRFFPPMEQLETMPLNRLRLVDVQTKEEEDILQGVINQRIEESPVVAEINRRDVPDITSPEQEAEWQKKIDERTAALKPKAVITEGIVENKIAELEAEREMILHGSGTIDEQGNVESHVDSVHTAEQAPFCMFCDSKGVTHKKVCTRTK